MPKTILIVEDNALNRKLFGDLLKANGYGVEMLSDGSEVIEFAKSCRPDLIIMDIQLPNVSGLDLIALMRKDDALAHTPCLAVTAYAGTGDEDRIIGAGANAYLSKPVSVAKLLTAVKSLIG